MARSVYARIADLRAVGLTDTALYDDARLWDLLELSSELVESLTRQFFGPRYLQLVLHGWGKRGVSEPDRNKIVEIESISVRNSLDSIGVIGTPGGSVIDPNSYAVDDRDVRLRWWDDNPDPVSRMFVGWPEHRFPYDDKNVTLAGVFGWLDLSEKFETTLAVALSKNATTVHLAETDELEANDLLLIDKRFWVVLGAVSLPAAPPVAGQVSIDPSPGKAELGAPVVRYGKVPRLVREAVIRTALAHRYLPGSEEETAAGQAQLVKREETDDYEIEFFGAIGRTASGRGSLASGTGDPRADAILSRFRAPVVAGEWV